MTHPDTSVLAAALACTRAGISIIPANWRTKQPAFDLLPKNPETGKASWDPFTSEIADENTVREWFRRGCQSFAVVGGPVSGGLYIFDFDEPRFYEAWYGEVGELVDQALADGYAYLEKSPRVGGGRHFAIRIDDAPANQKLAWVEDLTEDAGRRVAIETRGEKGYCLVAPSRHEAGYYEAISGSLSDLKVMPPAWFDVLNNAAISLDECPVTNQEVQKAKASPRASANGSTSVIETFNNRSDVAEILLRHGYTRHGGTKLNRPGDGTPGSVLLRDGMSVHFSSNDPLNDSRFGNGLCGIHSAFDVFCHLEHRGDVKAAVRAAAMEMGIAHETGAKSRLVDGGRTMECDDTDTPTAKPDDGLRGCILKRLSDVTPRKVEWLWPDRIAIGKITLFIGDPGLGKSFLTCDLGSRVSTGAPWPDDPFDTHREPADVILMNAEDGLDDTIRPRLDAAGADCSRIVAIEGVAMLDTDTKARRVHSFNLARDLPRLKEALIQNPETQLVIIDPISAFLGKTDSHSNAEVRGLLAPLAALADEHHVAMVLVSHMNKGGGSKAIYRTNGSLAFPAAARAAWLVAKDQVDDDRRLFLNVKNNLARNSGGLAFRIDSTGKLAWEDEPVTQTADELLACADDRPSKCESAQDWLAEYLKHGARPVKEIEAEAKAAGISAGTLRRAREGLGIRPEKAMGFGGGWTWGLKVRNAAKLTPASSSCAPCAPLDNESETNHFAHTLPTREIRCANLSGREEVRIIDERGEPLQQGREA